MLVLNLVLTIKLPVQGKINNSFNLLGNTNFWYLLTFVCGRSDCLIDLIVHKNEFCVKFRTDAGQFIIELSIKIKKRTIKQMSIGRFS